MKEKVTDAKSLNEQISFQLESILKGLESEESRKLTRSQSFDRQSLGLPSDFVKRDFLENSVGYKDRLEYLVGMVVKKGKNSNGEEVYKVIRDFKLDSTEVSARVPAQGILVEKKYDSKIGTGIQHLIASAELERNSAFQVLISDVSEITILDKSVDKMEIYKTYGKDEEIDSYYLVRAAVTTSILYKKFTKIAAKTEFNAAAIKVGASYYSESSDLKQDWKIGMQLTPIKEFLKGFTPGV